MSANKKYNFEGNFEDESGGSYYVIDEDGERIMGPFASGPYAITCRDRVDPSLSEDPSVEYDPDE